MHLIQNIGGMSIVMPLLEERFKTLLIFFLVLLIGLLVVVFTSNEIDNMKTRTTAG